MDSTLQVRLPVPLTDEHVRRLCTSLREQLRTGSVAGVVCRVDHPGDLAAVDLATVDAVARLALVARRAGVGFRLDAPGAELSSLLGLVGLRARLTGQPDP